jgi:hypothetical protein
MKTFIFNGKEIKLPLVFEKKYEPDEDFEIPRFVFYSSEGYESHKQSCIKHKKTARIILEEWPWYSVNITKGVPDKQYSYFWDNWSIPGVDSDNKA